MRSKFGYGLESGFIKTVARTLWVDRALSCSVQRLTSKYDEPLSNFAFNCNMRPYTLDRIPFPDESFDVVFSSEVLEHVPPSLAAQSVGLSFSVSVGGQGKSLVPPHARTGASLSLGLSFGLHTKQA